MNLRLMNLNVAIIPARSGSKRLVGKNIMDFLGKPMICWSIIAAKKSGIFDTILVSTDSEEIAKVAIDYGAIVPFLRDAADADDYTPVSTATTNALIKLEDYQNVRYDKVVQLMPTCPLRNENDILNAYKVFITTASSFQISVFKFGWMNPWWAMTIDSMRPTPIFPQALKERSQDLEPLYCPTGAIWIADAQELKKQKTFYGKDYTVFPMDWQNAIDIDDKDDLRMATALNERTKQGKQ